MAVEVKICGLSTSETMQAALDAGADYVGLVFFPRSPRNVTLDQARALSDQARGRAKIVALTVDAPDDALAAITQSLAPDFIQLHGAESSQRVQEITRRFAPVIKAIAVAGRPDVEKARAYRHAEFLLFDAKAPERLEGALPGGNGVSFDWSLLSSDGTPCRFMLSGGLNPGNVARAIDLTGARMVDVSSGVETAPGRKDARLIRNFVEAARAAR